MTTRTTKMPKITNNWIVFGFDGGGIIIGVGVGRGARVGSGASVCAGFSGAGDSWVGISSGAV